MPKNILILSTSLRKDSNSDALAAAICHNSFHGAHSIRGFK